ncbi:MAG: PIN domain-containing protein [Planctomycetaceae bacterium]|nr:PIN domain-containing protein [Planctomycetaceae bacterium]
MIEGLIASGLTLLPLPTDVVARWIDLARRYPVKGAEVFDLQLAAAMLAHGVTTIYTFNTPDFQRVTEIKALTP